MYKFLDRGCSVSAEKVNTEEPSVKKKKLHKFDYSYIKYDVMEYSEWRQKTVHTVLENVIRWSTETQPTCHNN